MTFRKQTMPDCWPKELSRNIMNLGGAESFGASSSRHPSDCPTPSIRALFFDQLEETLEDSSVARAPSTGNEWVLDSIGQTIKWAGQLSVFSLVARSLNPRVPEGLQWV